MKKIKLKKKQKQWQLTQLPKAVGYLSIWPEPRPARSWVFDSRQKQNQSLRVPNDQPGQLNRVRIFQDVKAKRPLTTRATEQRIHRWGVAATKENTWTNPPLGEWGEHCFNGTIVFSWKVQGPYVKRGVKIWRGVLWLDNRRRLLIGPRTTDSRKTELQSVLQ